VLNLKEGTPSGPPKRGLSWLVIRWRHVFFVAVLAVYGWSFSAGPLQFDRSLERMFVSGDPILAPFRHFQRTFGGNEVVLAVYHDPALFDSDGSGLRRLEEVGRRLREVEGLRDVFSLDRILGGPSVDLADPTVQRLTELFTGITHGRERTTAALVCLLDNQQPARHAAAVRALHAIMEEPYAGAAAGFVTGEPVLVHEGFSLVESDGRRLSLWTLVLLSGTILVCFRRLRWMVATLLVVHVSICLTEALLAASGLQLTLVSSMLAAIVAVVAIATMVHLIVWFVDQARHADSPSMALWHAIRRVQGPIFWSCVTDAAGFGSLMFAHVSPVRDFGLMTAIGSLIVLVCVFALFPVVTLFRFRLSDLRAGSAPSESFWLRRSIDLVCGYPRRLAAAIALGVIVVGLGSARVETETDFTRNFRADSPIVLAYAQVEEHLGGAGVLEVALPAPRSLTWSYFQSVLRLEERLRDESTGLTKVISLADAVVVGSPVAIESLPTSELRDVAVKAGVQGMRLKMPAFVDSLVALDPDDPDRAWFRIMLRGRERQSVADKLASIRTIRQIIDEEVQWQVNGENEPNAVNARPRQAYLTGYFVLLANLIQSVSQDQWLTFAIATVGVAICLLLAFRNLKLVAIALVPNIIPGFLVLGVMGWSGLKINMGAAMIAAVSMGLTVDSSVHYLTAYLHERSRGASLRTALDHAQQGVGKAALLSTLALMIGFSVLCTSDFIPTVYFGFLVNLAMLGGVAGNLLILPLLLLLWDRGPQQPAAVLSSGIPSAGRDINVAGHTGAD
jgi:predicted RND superfamily exporter protein